MIIQILKNGVPIKELNYTPKTLQRDWDTAYDMAGGMWNGVDTFTVILLN
jgi:hypothetical protein